MAILEGAGVRDVEGTELAVTVTHPTFEKWWEPAHRASVSPRGDREALARGPGYAGRIMTRSLLLRCRSEA